MIMPKGWSGISKYISSSSALNPALLTILMITLPSLPLAYLSIAPICYFFMLMAALPMLVALWQIQKFTQGDTSQLRNDRHIEKMAALRMGSNVAGKEIEITLTPNPVLIENPNLEAGEEK